jgi:hypothetical protein
MGEVWATIVGISLIVCVFGTLIFSCIMMYKGWKDARGFYSKFNEFVEEFKKQK